MSRFSFTVAFLLPVKAEKSKNFRELLKYARLMGFHIGLSRCVNNSKLLLRFGKAHCGALEVASLFVALHLLATQRKEDLIIVGTIDATKFQHCFFATLSIEKIHDWTSHLMKRLASSDVDAQGPVRRLPYQKYNRPRTTSEERAAKSKSSAFDVTDGPEPRVLH